MNWLDFLILALIAWFTLTAYLSGLIRETVALAAVVLGVVLAGLFHDDVARNLATLGGGGAGAEVGAFLGIFVTVALLGWIASRFLRKIAHLFLLGWADHAAGALFGFIKGIVIIQAVTIIFVLQPTFGMADVIADSTIGSFFLDTTPVVRALLPGNFDAALQDFSA